MFCTNCGEEMRATDKFCANCGTAAAPRPAKTREVASIPTEPPAPVRAAQSTAEAFHAPLPATSTSAARVKQPVPPLKSAAAPPPLSRQQEEQVLLEAEEIASVRDMLPIDALPEDFSSAGPPPITRTGGQTCASCGEPNPVGNRFCERCGKSLQAEAPVRSTPVPATARSSAPPPRVQSSWLDVPEPAQAVAAAPVKSAASRKAAPSPASPVPTAKDDNFFYFYDDSSAPRSNRKLLIPLMVVLALGVLGVIYLLSRPSARSTAGANITVTISPTEAQVVSGQAHDFVATVSGSGDTDVNWSVAEGSAGGKMVNRGAQAQGGTVSDMAVYVAPSTPGSYHVVATSKADTSKSATAQVTVNTQ